MRVAFLADIHGNLPALEAVLRDLARQAPDAVYLVGDQINRCPWNNEVLDLLADRGWPAIAGNHELALGVLGTPRNRPPLTDRDRFAVLWWTWAQLFPRHLAAIRGLPAEMHLAFDGAQHIRMVHGVPGNAWIGFSPGLENAVMAGYLDGVEESVVVCAHTHRPLDREIGRRRIFNGGAVGLPYNGDPRAQYLLLDLVREAGKNRWRPTFRQLEYDRERVERAFVSSGLLAATIPLGRLDLLTVQSGHPWTSDFGIWLRDQPKSMESDLNRAMECYLATHGPGNWAFDERTMATK